MRGLKGEVCCNPLHSIIPASLCFSLLLCKERMKYGFHSKLAALSQDAYFFAGWNANKGRKKVPHLEESTVLQRKHKTTKKECNKFLKQFQKVPLKEIFK